MKHSRIYAAALLILIATVAAADRYKQAGGSVVRVEGTSSLHAWKMEGSTIEGTISTPSLDQWQNGTAASEVMVSIPVTSIKSEHARMDKLMAAALKAEKHPHIKYEMTSAILTTPGETFVLTTRGKLNIAGVTRDVEMKVTGAKNGAGPAYILNGQLPIKMSDYGIKPPTAMLGTVKTGDDVKVSFSWVVSAQN